MTEDNFKEELKQIPEPSIECCKLSKIEKIVIPHPYMITPKHLEYSSSMYLNIEEAEKKGAVCGICKKLNKKEGKPILTYDQHEQIKTLFIEVPHHDLNKIEGLNEYLNIIKSICEEFGIKGFAFPISK